MGGKGRETGEEELRQTGTISAGLGIWHRQLPGSGDAQSRRKIDQGQRSRPPTGLDPVDSLT